MNSSPTSWETGPADLHFHSRFSDGVFWPSELVARLATDGITMAALTDHDTFAGVPEFLGLAREAGVTGVAAVEIDFTDTTFCFQSELLAYFPGGQYARTDALLRPFQGLRREVARHSVEKARRLWPGADLTLEGFVAYKRGPLRSPDAYLAFSISKADFFNYARSQVTELSEAVYENFKRSFYDEDPAFRPFSSKPELTECLRQIRADGGFPVLAHPGYQFGRDAARLRADCQAYVGRLRAAREAGLWGVELHTYKSADDSARRFCRYHNLPTGLPSASHPLSPTILSARLVMIGLQNRPALLHCGRMERKATIRQIPRPGESDRGQGDCDSPLGAWIS